MKRFIYDGVPPIFPLVVTEQKDGKILSAKVVDAKYLQKTAAAIGLTTEEYKSLLDKEVKFSAYYNNNSAVFVAVDAHTLIRCLKQGSTVLSLFQELMTLSHKEFSIGEPCDLDGLKNYCLKALDDVTSSSASIVEKVISADKKPDKAGDSNYALRGSRIVYKSGKQEVPANIITFFKALEPPLFLLPSTINTSDSLVFEGVDITMPGKTKFSEISGGAWKRNHWCIDPPSELELTPNEEMLAKVNKHLEGLGATVTGLSLRNLAYYSDGGFALTPDALPKTFVPPFSNEHVSGGHVTSPLIYCGEAWCVTITHEKCNSHGLHIYFTTPDRYIKAYQDVRPDIAELYKKEQWGEDGLLFICSDWCERNGKKNYNNGIDLQAPCRLRKSLRDWLLSSYTQKYMSNGIVPFKNIKILQSKGPSKEYTSAMHRLDAICEKPLEDPTAYVEVVVSAKKSLGDAALQIARMCNAEGIPSRVTLSARSINSIEIKKQKPSSIVVLKDDGMSVHVPGYTDNITSVTEETLISVVRKYCRC